jgi:threonine/homoserine/homoserine lactone efflux protein
MFELHTIIMFISASALLAVAPGPDNIFVLTQSMVHGRKAGFLITLGLCTGLIVHTLLVSLGVAVIFQKSLIAFNILKYCGACYLAWLAYKSFRAGATHIETEEASELPSGRLYRRGIIMNITNPKVALFFMAFLPQFASSSNGSMPLQMVFLGCLFIVVTLIVFGLVSQLAGYVGEFMTRSERAGRILNRVAGTVFLALALKLIFIEQA